MAAFLFKLPFFCYIDKAVIDHIINNHIFAGQNMRKIKLYIASSLDGKIASDDGSFQFLDEYNSPAEDYGYTKFLDSVDTTIMGNTTYQQINSIESEFPYIGKRNFVFTRNTELKEDENVTFLSHDQLSVIQSLKEEPGKDIWLIGGGKVNSFFLKNKLIDELILFVMPVLLGNGIPLFEKADFLASVQLTGTKTYDNGVIELRYNFHNA